MDEYIKREDALDAVLFALSGTGYQSRAITAIRDVPAVDVAREIFEEIEKLSYRFMNDKHYIFGDMVWDIAILKKKYTEG